MISVLGGFKQAANPAVKSQRNNRKIWKWSTLNGCRFVQNIAPPSLSGDGKIKKIIGR